MAGLPFVRVGVDIIRVEDWNRLVSSLNQIDERQKARDNSASLPQLAALAAAASVSAKPLSRRKLLFFWK